MREAGHPQLPAPVGLACVGAAAAGSRLFVNGLSVLKIRSQVGAPGGKVGFSRGLYWIGKVDGWRGLMRGSHVAAIRAFPHYTIQFAVYDRLAKTLVHKPAPDGAFSRESLKATFVAGATGGVAATLVTHPLDVLKVRLVVQNAGRTRHYEGATDAFRQILAKEGLYRGVYRGLAVSVVGSAVWSGSMFALWDVAEFRPWHRRGAEPFVFVEWLVAPTVACCLAAAVSHPFDVVRRKFMAQSFVLPRDGGVDVQFRYLHECLYQMFRVSGLSAVLHGMTANMVKMGPQVAAYMAIYKWTQWSMLTVSGQKSLA